LAVGASLPAQPQLLVPLTQPRPTPSPAARSCEGMSVAQLTEAQQEARQFRVPQLKGRRLAREVKKLTRELDWHRELDDAAAAAAQEGKPILWIQLLGDLPGRT
jgi:hypothetical protein